MENTAKNFALQLGSLASLYISLSALIVLLFGVINIQFPDPALDYYYSFDGDSSSIRFSIAFLVVFFPAYLILTRLVNKIRRTEHGTYLALTKWLIYISLLIGGGVLLGDLVMILNNFLNGDLTTRFILKAIAFFLVVGTAFVYYLFDARGYWQAHEKTSIKYGGIVSVVVITALISGFMKIETPAQVREMRIDETQVNDLQMIQTRIEEFNMVNAKLPTTISEVYVGMKAPESSAERAAYRYNVIDKTTYELCAEFAYPTPKSQQGQYSIPMLKEGFYTWDHGTGEKCFERKVITDSDPTFMRIPA
jgi:hypothetical protein